MNLSFLIVTHREKKNAGLAAQLFPLEKKEATPSQRKDPKPPTLYPLIPLCWKCLLCISECDLNTVILLLLGIYPKAVNAPTDYTFLHRLLGGHSYRLQAFMGFICKAWWWQGMHFTIIHKCSSTTHPTQQSQWTSMFFSKRKKKRGGNKHNTQKTWKPTFV